MEELNFWEKIKILAPTAIITWIIFFVVSLFLNHDTWWINALATFGLVAICTIDMTTWQGEEYDPDRMP